MIVLLTLLNAIRTCVCDVTIILSFSECRVHSVKLGFKGGDDNVQVQIGVMHIPDRRIFTL